jgi:hypothetical protein
MADIEKDLLEDDDDLGVTLITLMSEDGEEFDLELLAEVELRGDTYVALYMGGDECEDEECEHDHEEGDSGVLIMRKEYDEENNAVFETVDDDELVEEVFQLLLIEHSDLFE